MKYIDNLISIIIPVFKAERHIKQCIESILNQTCQEFEIVLIDDCSPDNSANIIENISKTETRIRYHKLEKNSGAAVARNKGLELAKGRYVAFLDSDDLWKKDKLQKQIELIKNKETALVCGAIEMIDESGKIVKSKRKIPNKITYSKLLRNTAIATSTVLIDRQMTEDFRMPLLRSGQDYATWLMLLRKTGLPAYSIQDVVTSYRRTEGSLSSKKTKNWKKVYKIQTEFEGIPKIKAFFNCVCYIFNSIKKYFF